jgi:DNA-binding CsgD family transcriptional regulator
VEKLAVYGSFANGHTLSSPRSRDTMIELVRNHWGLGSRLLAEIFVPSGDSAERESFARFQQKSADAAIAADLLRLTFETDVREEASRLRTRPLVVHRRGDRAIPFRAGEELAALANAELVELAGDSHMPWYGDDAEVVAALAPHLGFSAPQPEPRQEAEQLTDRERDVLRLVAEGLSDAEIAKRLVLSPHTVHRHVANIRRKLNLHSRTAAAAYAARTGLV